MITIQGLTCTTRFMGTAALKAEAMNVKHTALLQRCWSEEWPYWRYKGVAEKQDLHLITCTQYAEEMVKRDEHAIATSYTNFEF